MTGVVVRVRIGVSAGFGGVGEASLELSVELSLLVRAIADVRCGVSVDESSVDDGVVFFKIDAALSVSVGGDVLEPAALFSRLMRAISSSSETWRAVDGGRLTG